MTTTTLLRSILITSSIFCSPNWYIHHVGAASASGETGVNDHQRPSHHSNDSTGSTTSYTGTDPRTSSPSPISVASSSCPAMAEELVHLTQKYKDLNSTLTQQCDSQIKGYRSQFAGLHEQLHVCEMKNNSIKTKTQDDMLTLKDELTNCTNSTSELEQKVLEMDKVSQGYSTKAEGLHEQLITCETNHESLNSKLQGELSALKGELRHCTDSTSEMQEKAGGMETQLKECEARYDSMSTKFHHDLGQTKDDLDRCNAATHEMKQSLQQMNATSQECALKLESKLSYAESTTAENKQNLSLLQACKQDLESSKQKAESSLHSLQTLQENADVQKSRQQTHMRKLESQITELTQDKNKLKKQARSYQDRYHDARDEVRKLEGELSRMHRNAQMTYVNTTLIMIDMEKFVSRQVDFSFKMTSSWMKRSRPYRIAARNYLLEWKGKVEDVASPWVVEMRKNIDLYVSPKYIQVKEHGKEFYNQYLSETVDPIWEEYGMAAIDGIRTSFEAVHLTMISIFSETSRVGSQYIQLKHESESDIPSYERAIMAAFDYVHHNAEAVTHLCWITLVLLSTYEIGLIHFFCRLMIHVMLIPLYPFYSIWKKLSETRKKS